jgi:replicative superfamily II helicase
MATVFSSRGTSIAVGSDPGTTWGMAREVIKVLPKINPVPEQIQLVQRFLAAEISPQFELIEMLSHGVGVHHAGLSDEVRSLIEWLTERGDIKVLCATTTLAQGINFPVSSIFMAKPEYRLSKFPFRKKMAAREFWNLAGRAGRMNQDSVGVVGIADANCANEIRQYVRDAAGELVSQLVSVVAELDQASDDEALLSVIHADQWEDFRCYVNHLVHEIKNLDSVIANVENSLRNTYGYRVLQESPEGRSRAQKLIEATKLYARKISENPGQVARADNTGFSFEGVGNAMNGISALNRELTTADFSADRLFGNASGMADLYGIMLRIPQLARNLKDITENGIEHQQLADITRDWVNGRSIQEIATAYFRADQGQTQVITEVCKAIYRTLINNGTWGLSALSRLSGIDFDHLSDEQKRHINLLPAMIYHGVRTEEGVLMRMNSVPRSIAETMGESYRQAAGESAQKTSIHAARDFIASAEIAVWNKARPGNSPLSATEYRDIWRVLSGVET